MVDLVISLISWTALQIVPAAWLISETPPSFSSCLWPMTAESIIEPTIPAREVKNAVFRPSSRPGIDLSRSPESKAIRPIVIPKKVPSTPRVETNVGKYSIILRCSKSLSDFLKRKTQRRQTTNAAIIMPRHIQVEAGIEKFMI